MMVLFSTGSYIIAKVQSIDAESSQRVRISPTSRYPNESLQRETTKNAGENDDYVWSFCTWVQRDETLLPLAKLHRNRIY